MITITTIISIRVKPRCAEWTVTGEYRRRSALAAAVFLPVCRCRHRHQYHPAGRRHPGCRGRSHRAGPGSGTGTDDPRDRSGRLSMVTTFTPVIRRRTAGGLLDQRFQTLIGGRVMHVVELVELQRRLDCADVLLGLGDPRIVRSGP